MSASSLEVGQPAKKMAEHFSFYTGRVVKIEDHADYVSVPFCDFSKKNRRKIQLKIAMFE